MYYVIHNLGVAGDIVAESLRDRGLDVGDVRPDDTAVPDHALAGKFWSGAQVTTKLCDMFSAKLFDSTTVFVVANAWDINLKIVDDLNQEYKTGCQIYYQKFNNYYSLNDELITGEI